MMKPIENVTTSIKTRKRRIVRPEDRKNTKSSCDRCKTKKLACKRQNPDPDSSDPCLKCLKAGVECQTTIQRKKKPRRPLENIGLHYKCLYALVKGSFPDIDTNDIDALVTLGISKGITMPSRFGASSKEEKDDMLQISVRLTGYGTGDDKSSYEETIVPKMEDVSFEPHESSLSVSSAVPSLSSTVPSLSSTVTDPIFMTHTPSVSPTDIELPSNASDIKFSQQDSVIIDQGGVCHYVGPFGAAGFLDNCVNLLLKSSTIESNLWDNYQKLFQSEIIISSKQEPLNSSQLKTSAKRGAGFPYMDFTSRKESDHYLNTFLKYIHPRYPCFNESTIKSNYETFWMFLLLDISNDKMLNNPQVCSIYLMLILGWMYSPYSELPESHGTCDMNDMVVQEYITAIRFFVSDMLLSPSLDGIRCMIMLSIYMDNNKRRDTGYSLIEAAARQAVTIGLNRQSVTYCIDSEDLIKEMKMTWWTLFKVELVFSCQMGRSSCLQLEDVDIEAPVFPTKFSYYFKESIGLSKILYQVMEYRKQVKTDIMSHRNIQAANDILQQFRLWSKTAPQYTETCDPLVFDLLFRYHYYVISLTLPILLCVTHQESYPDITCHDLIQDCLHSSVEITQLFELSSERGLFNGTVFQDIFFIYHAAMTLVAGYIFINKHQISWPQAKFQDITDSINIIRKTNLDNFNRITGSNKKISKFINILFNGLNILEFLGVNFFQTRTAPGICRPIIHMPKMTSGSAHIYIKHSKTVTVSPSLKPLDEEILKIFTSDFDVSYKEGDGNHIDNLETI